jgi:hypothetical protein
MEKSNFWCKAAKRVFILRVVVMVLAAGMGAHISDAKGPGDVIFKGSFPLDAIEADPQERLDIVIAEVKDAAGTLLGTVQSRNKNLALAFVASDGREKIIWQYSDYSSVSKITLDQQERLLKLSHKHSLLWVTHSITTVNVDSLKVESKIIRFGG